MFSINAVPLDNATYGWSLAAQSKPLSDVLRRVQGFTLPNRDGMEPVPGAYDSPSIALVVQTPRSALETLYAVFGASDLVLSQTDTPTRTVGVELLSAVVEGLTPVDAIVNVTFTLRLTGAFWRGPLVTSPVVTVNAASVAATVLSGLSAPVGDVLVRVRGPITNAVVTDSAGSYLSIPVALTASQYVRFNPKTGEAFLTTTDVWTGGTDYSGVVDFGGPRGYFEITPAFDPTPATRSGKVTITSTARTNAQFQTQGRTAHLV